MIVNFGIQYIFSSFYADICHKSAIFAPSKPLDMNEEILKNRYKTVCDAPSGNGLQIDHMPDFLLHSDIDDSRPHVHTFYEILWFQEGEGRHTVDFMEYEICPNMIFFLAPGQVHHFDHNRNYRGVAIKMCTNLMKAEEDANKAFVKYNTFHTFHSSPYCIIDPQTAQKLKALVFEMEEELRHASEFGSIDILKSLLRIFMVNIQRYGEHAGEMHLDNLKPQHRLFIQFRRQVEKEYSQLHTVQEYADRLNVSVRTLNKCVNDCSGMSPLAFINDRILLEAKRLVRYTNMMFKEIAFDLGFEDPSYFVKLFKRATGYLPSDFRELECVTHCRVDFDAR